MTRVLVIAGWGRSGSTILANVLGSAPGVVTLGEINNLWDRGFRQNLLCSCGDPFRECDLWQPITEKAFGDTSAAVADRANAASAGLGNTWLVRRRLPLLGRGQSDKGDGYAEMLAQLYAAAAAETEASLLIDASKSPWHCAIASSLDGFDVSVVHLIRDPRGVAHSLRKKVAYEQGGKSIEMDRHGPTASSAAWVYRNRLVEWEWRGDSRYLQMRYEDFIASPATAVAAISQLVGGPPIEVPFTGPNEVAIAPSHNISGNPVRFRKGPVALKADDAWKDSLPQHVRRYVQAITWPHMGHFGYR